MLSSNPMLARSAFQKFAEQLRKFQPDSPGTWLQIEPLFRADTVIRKATKTLLVIQRGNQLASIKANGQVAWEALVTQPKTLGQPKATTTKLASRNRKTKSPAKVQGKKPVVKVSYK